MNNLVCDMTHGGVKIAISLAKKGRNVLAYDIYSTLKGIDLKMLEVYDITLVTLEDLKDFRGDMNVIYPIHFPLTHEEIISYNPGLNYTFQTHHEAVGEILKDWKDDFPVVEVTGVKGKTSAVFMLKEILNDKNPLVLSSLGAMLFCEGKEILLKKNISITPANIKETVDLAYKMANPICKIAEGRVMSENLRKYDSAIFESSLGVSGIADVGLLLNIAEDYPIAGNKSSASEAKKQVFRCPCVCIEKETLDEYYSDVEHENINTFSLSDENADLFVKNAVCSLDKSLIEIEYRNVKTVRGKLISGKLTLESFAPAEYHVKNLLGAVLTALCLETDGSLISANIKNYKGIIGRTNKKEIGDVTVIEEINPGLNTEAIRQAVRMVGDYDDYLISIGGDYGITCEEIDEEKLSGYLNTLNKKILLCGKLGLSVSKKLNCEYLYFESASEVYDYAIKNRKNLLFIYRSDYRKVDFR